MLRTLLPIAAVLCGTAFVARASCAMELVGDPDVAAYIRDAMVAFGDDSAACVELRVLCSRNGDELVLDLHDQVGRSVQRRFATPEGAAAFLISWSRRPLPQAGTGLERSGASGATAPGAGPAADPLPPLLPAVPPWQGELRAAYMGAPFVDGWAGAVEGALVRRDGVWRYGATARVVGASVNQVYLPDETPTLMWLGLSAQGTGGAAWTFDQVTLRAEAVAGLAYVSVVSKTANLHAQTVGPCGGVRAALASRLFSTLWLEGGIGWDVVRQTGEIHQPENMLGPDRFVSHAHLEIGLLWAP